MKRLGILLMCVATLALASCSALQSAASSDAVAQTAGQTAGSALLNLYKIYKNTGTISLTDATALSSAISLATAYTQIKNNKNNSSYRKAFANGLVLSSAGLVTNSNSNSFIDALLAASALGSISSTSSTSQNNAAESTITGLVRNLGK